MGAVVNNHRARITLRRLLRAIELRRVVPRVFERFIETTVRWVGHDRVEVMYFLQRPVARPICSRGS